MARRIWYTTADGIDDLARQSVIVAGLDTLWPELSLLQIDVAGLAEDGNLHDAVIAVDRCRGRRRNGVPTDTVTLEPGRDDDLLPAARILVVTSIGTDGLDLSRGLIWSVDDTSESVALRLTDHQHASLLATMRSRRVDTALLVPLR